MVIFFDQSSGKIGGKESALEAAQAMLSDSYTKLLEEAPDYGKMYLERDEPFVNVAEKNLWVKIDENRDPLKVYKRKDGNWDTEVTGKTAIYAKAVATYSKKVNSLYNDDGEKLGLYTLMVQACALVQEIAVLKHQYNGHVSQLNAANTNFSLSFGDMLREGYWNNSNYIVGQEQELYDDALEIIEVMAQPEITYTVEPIDLYSQQNSSYRVIDPSFDVDITPELTDDGLVIGVPRTLDGISFPKPVSQTEGELEVA